MANPLFYRQVVPLNRETHRSLTFRAPDRPLDYAREAHLIPAVVDEFAAAAAEIPIAFLPGAGQPAAVFVTGLRPGVNAFIGPQGRWDGHYVPAYLRRYPFIVGEVPNAEPVLCIDEAFEGFAEAGGKPLFSSAGEPEASVTDALNLANNYRAAALRTDALARLLQQFELLRSVSFEAKLSDGQSTVVHGLLVVDEKAFAALSDERFLELRHAGFINPILAHLWSLSTVSRLANKATPPIAAAS
jgi:hypothetical protein